MTRNRKLMGLMCGLLVLAMVSTACDLPVDCSGINQPDNGSLVCLGLNAGVLQAFGLLIAALLGLGTAA